MVYLHFPSELTEEEQMLQAKYQKLKKKKKAVVALKAPKVEEKTPVRGGGAQAQARDAREHARKLLKSGAIRAIATPPPKHNQLSFKRPRAGRERKLSGPGSLDKVGASYQPFSSVQDPPDDKSPPRVNSLYDSFVVARDKEERVEPQKPKSAGNTVFVMGHKISEEYLRKHLGQHGTIVNVSMEVEKHRGFVTFEKPESAQKAITELNGIKVAGIQLEVSMARRQPQMERINEASSSSAWSSLATSQSQKGPHRDGRTMVSYDDLFAS